MSSSGEVRILRGDEGEVKDLRGTLLHYIAPSSILFISGIVLSYYGAEEKTVLGLFLLSYLLVGWRVLKNALLFSLRKKILDENFLMSVATLGAFLIRQYPEAVGVMLFYVVGEFLQDLAVGKSRRSIRSLLKLKAERANLLLDGKVVKVKPEELKVGDQIVVRPGERIPVDGIVVEGSSSVDASTLTGESAPRDVREGEEVLSGMVNLRGVLRVRVTRELKESTVSRILDLWSS